MTTDRTDVEALVLVLTMIGTSLASGIIAGLLGVGGGIVVVPMLEYALRFTDVPPEVRIHVAIATSMATIVPTSVSSALAHHRRSAVDWALVRTWALPLLAGAVGGSVLAARSDRHILTAVFASVCALMAFRMMLPELSVRILPRVTHGGTGAAIASVIGGVSAMMGIGGGTLSVPVMTGSGVHIHTAIGTAAVFGFVISLPATISYLLADAPPDLPVGTVGLVSILGTALIAPGSVLAAPFGAWMAHSLSRPAIARVFAAFLLIVAARMLYRTLN